MYLGPPMPSYAFLEASRFQVLQPSADAEVVLRCSEECAGHATFIMCCLPTNSCDAEDRPRSLEKAANGDVLLACENCGEAAGADGSRTDAPRQSLTWLDKSPRDGFFKLETNT